jgi:CRISPR-associated protein (TIGR03986 family)
MPTKKGTLKVTGDSYEVEWESNKGNPVTRKIPDSAQRFRDEDAEEGGEVDIKFHSGKIREVTIPGRPTISAPSGGRSAPSGSSGSGQAGSGPRRDATAPFNFVPCDPDRVALWNNDDVPDASDGLSGHVSCRLRALKPLLVAGPQERDSDEPRTFFEVDGTPTIPASSLKGMVRKVLEVMSYSKLAPVTSEQIYYRNVQDSQSTYADRMEKVRGGFLVRSGAEARIYPARFAQVRYREISSALSGQSPLFSTLASKSGRRQANSNIGDYSAAAQTREWMQQAGSEEVSFSIKGDPSTNDSEVNELTKNKGKYRFDGTIVFTGHIPRKKRDFVFFPAQNKPIPVDPEVYDLFREQLTDPQKDLLKAYKENGRQRVPVFWLPDEGGEVGQIGLARMFRLHCAHRPKDLARPGREGRDFCELLFGYADDDGSLRGRVRFGPARPREDSIERTERPFHAIQAGPSASCVSLYLQQGSSGARVSDKGRNLGLTNYNSGNPKLRGRKFYWHTRPAEPATEDVSEEMQNDYIPLQSDAEFDFTVRFEGLSEAELGGLLEALEPRENPAEPDQRMAHKIGLGKNFGLGSVRVRAGKVFCAQTHRIYGDLADRITRSDDATEATAQQRHRWRRAFRQQICEKIDANPEYYAKQEEMAALFCMLDAKDRPPRERITFMPLNGNPGYTDSPILPSPQQVAKDD